MLFKKSRLLVFDAEFTVYGGKYSLYLTKCEHASEERISGIVVALFVAEHRHSVVYTHGKGWIYLLEYACQLYQVGTSAEV